MEKEANGDQFTKRANHGNQWKSHVGSKTHPLTALWKIEIQNIEKRKNKLRQTDTSHG